MPQNFIACDREQVMLMPPSLLDWVPSDHLVWSILSSVAEMDLEAIYEVYRADGHGRPAYEPSMMVALLLYSYSRGNRSSRGIERECREDVVYKLIAAQRVPDHSTIAEFRKRHEVALAELFGEVLELCKEAGLVNVGVITVDGTKVAASASNHANRDYRQIVKEILAEADRIDEEEDGRYGEKRGDELPEELQTPAGRREALREAKRRLQERKAAARADSDDDEDRESAPVVELDPERFVTRPQGRRAWFREARRELEIQREQQARPIARDRHARLLEAVRRLEEELEVEIAASDQYEAHRAARVAAGVPSNRIGGPWKPYTSPEEPEGKINLTDPDSRNLKISNGYVQGYNAQAVVAEGQIVIAAEVEIGPQDFGNLGPMVIAARRELTNVGVAENPEVVLADSGYWHSDQMDKLADDGIETLIPPDSSKREGPRPGWTGGRYEQMRQLLASETGAELYRRRQVMIEPVFGQIKSNRKIDRFLRRGRAAARSEWRLVAATHNLLKLHNHRLAAAGP